MQINVSHHPLIEDKIARLRDIKTDKNLFRSLVDELTTLVAYEATRDLELTTVEVTTPVTKTKAKKLEATKIALIPVLRAGLGMVNGCLALLPNASVWHIGMARNEETLQPEVYYNNLQDGTKIDEVFILDPMLATGGSSSAAISALKEKGAQKIKFMCLLAAPEGVKKLNQDHPDVEIFGAMLDENLNEKGYIVPGLGDAGDRLFGT